MSQATKSAPIGASHKAADLANLLASKTSLPASIAPKLRRAAAAIVLAKAGKALSPNVAKARSVLSSLETVDALAGLSGDLTQSWLALRALNLPSGAQIGLSDAKLADPLVEVLLNAANLVPTTDAEATVRGVLGDMGPRCADTLVANARIVVDTAPGTLVVKNTTGTLFAIDTTQSGEALDSIDKKSAPVTSGKAKITPLAYNKVEIAELGDFDTAMFSPYKVRRVEIPGAKTHPTSLVESAALASVLPPVPSYQPHLHPDVIARGALSDVQLEAIIYAGEAHSKYLPSHPDDDQKIAPRQGICLGHGTGFGKGATIGGIIADNWAQGRRRHIWFSESAHLIADARRDWVANGGRADDIIDIRDLPSEGAFAPFAGIIFATYASLRSITDHNSRQKQLVDWFGAGEDGVVIFDEAQNLRNTRAKSKRDWSEVSLQGLAALALQDALPNARVVYSSATSASDIASLGFAIRLGLWGKGTAFATADAFFKELEAGGTNALEMVARDLKAMGLYLSANLSFEGVKYERVLRKLTPQERDAQDRLANLWVEVREGLKRARTTTGYARLPKKTKGATGGSQFFGMARARFFQALDTALNTPQLIEMAKEDIKKGHAVNIQLTNTFEANAARAIEDAQAAGESVDDIAATPRDILKSYLEKQFPIYKVQAVKRLVGGKYIIRSEIELDADGNPVECPKAVAVRDQLLARADAEAMPTGPLEQIFAAFGTEMVAEITGRRQRLVPNGNGGQKIEERSPADVAADLKAYNNDKKRILVFSLAGNAGGTYSAQRTYLNQRLRRHYLLQAGWRADMAIQGAGRSHRSDQVQPPEYILLSTDLWASRRMASAVARGMRDLGALTRGLRQAASQDFFTSEENLEDEFGEAAWRQFVEKLCAGKIHGLSVAEFERQAGIEVSAKGQMLKNLPAVRRFLNTMSAMTCDNQDLFGQNYRAELVDLRLQAIEDGTFDRGIETITPDSLIKLDDAVIYRDPRTGGETRLLKMLRVDELRPVDYQTARRTALAKGNTRVVKSLLTGRIAILAYPRLPKGHTPTGEDKVEVIMPNGTRTRTREEVVQERWSVLDATIAESLWNAELKERGEDEEMDFWVVAGAMLPIWDKLPRDRSTVYRMETDEGEQVIGRLVSEDFVKRLLKRVDALTDGGLPQAEVDTTLLKGGVVTLVNDWVLSGRVHQSSGDVSITLQMPLTDEAAHIRLVQSAGLKSVYGPLTTVAYLRLPSEDDKARNKSLSVILNHAVAVGAALM
jgi:hypothetical protein